MNAKSLTKIVIFVIVIIGLLTGTAVITAKVTKKSLEAKDAARQAEAVTESEPVQETDTRLDKYSMQKFCQDNSKAVFKALKENDIEALRDIMISSDGIESVAEFAKWEDADFDKAVSMGSGSLTAEPDAEGRMDESERFFVYVGDKRYTFFIETRTSDHGRTNDGVSAIGVTTFSHFDSTDYAWNGEKDDQSALAGELFWKKQKG